MSKRQTCSVTSTIFRKNFSCESKHPCHVVIQDFAVSRELYGLLNGVKPFIRPRLRASYVELSRGAKARLDSLRI